MKADISRNRHQAENPPAGPGRNLIASDSRPDIGGNRSGTASGPARAGLPVTGGDVNWSWLRFAMLQALPIDGRPASGGVTGTPPV